MKTKATVISVNGKFATVETVRNSACDGCHKLSEDGKGCAVCSLAGGGNQKLTATADNALGAIVGDNVMVETPASRVLLYASLVFLLPLAACAIGLAIACAVTEKLPWRAAGAGIGFVLTFLGLRIYSGVLKKKQPDVIITEILSSREEA